jgi:hypothetical protein
VPEIGRSGKEIRIMQRASDEWAVTSLDFLSESVECLSSIGRREAKNIPACSCSNEAWRDAFTGMVDGKQQSNLQDQSVYLHLL